MLSAGMLSAGMLSTADLDPVVKCNTGKYGSYLLSLMILVTFGLVLGHISQSARKLFKIFNKLYCYLVLPCMSLYCGIAVKFSQWSQTKPMEMILSDFLTKAAIWLVIVLGALLIFRRSSILKLAAITAQFVIHANDIGFSKTLLESSCYHIQNGTDHKEPINFSSIELSTNVMDFLIFLPLTHGLVDMSNKNQIGFRQFVLSYLQHAYKFSFSYLALLAGFIISLFLKDSPNDFAKVDETYFDSVATMINFSSTMQTLNCGVYIYYILMNCDWGHLKILKTLGLTAAVSLFYPAVYYAMLYLVPGGQMTEKNGADVVIIIAHAITPASIYVQYYILKHERSPSNFIAAFLASTFFGTLLMYTVIMDYEVFATNYTTYNTPVDYYTESQRITILGISVILSIFAMLNYARCNQSVLRTMIFVVMLTELLRNVILGVTTWITGGDANSMSVVCPMLLSAFIMFGHIETCGMVFILSLYKLYPVIRMKWKLFILLVFGISLAIPVILYTPVWVHFGDMTNFPNLTYSKDIDNFLDIHQKSDIDDQFVYPISVAAYGCINGVIIVIYIAMFVMKYKRRSVYQENIQFEREDQEKFVACKIMMYYQLTLIVLSIAFAIRNIDYKQVRGKDTNTGKVQLFADYILQGVELFAMILADLSGAVMTVIFCISPGEMDKEYDRLMFIPRKIRSIARRGCDYGIGPIDVHNLPREDLQRCRVFVQYHKGAFLGNYPPEFRDNLTIFKGTDLVDFLIDTEVADSVGEAIELCNSYMKGDIFKVEQSIFRRGFYQFEENVKYVFTEEELPDFQRILRDTERPIIYLD